MNVEGFEFVLSNYEDRLTELNGGNWNPDSKDNDRFSSRESDSHERIQHLQTMIPQMLEMLGKNEEGKFFRWLGFMQGTLWSLGVYSLNELRSHNRGICSK